jgi:magnesium-transporting ATPase (P-type)
MIIIGECMDDFFTKLIVTLLLMVIIFALILFSIAVYSQNIELIVGTLITIGICSFIISYFDKSNKPKPVKREAYIRVVRIIMTISCIATFLLMPLSTTCFYIADYNLTIINTMDRCFFISSILPISITTFLVILYAILKRDDSSDKNI